MTLLQSLILGIVQGLTEFLPISSSAHLVLVPYLLGWKIPAEQAFIFDVLVQLGTLVAVIVYFWKDLVRVAGCVITGIINHRPFDTQEARLGWLLILATIPAGLFGLAIKSTVEAAFSSPVATALFLLLTALLLYVAELTGRRVRTLESLSWVDALWIGVAQAISIFPGVSRSGSTIAGGMTRGFKRSDSSRFAFLMAIPVMLSAGLIETLDLLSSPNLAGLLPQILVGFITAAVVGYLAIRWLMGYLARRSLNIFAIYCVVACAVVIGYTLL